MAIRFNATVARWFLIIPLCGLAGVLTGCTHTSPPVASTQLAAPPQAAKPLAVAGVKYWFVTRQEPRPLRVHHLRIDLGNPGLELGAVLAADPDGPGPATAELTLPLTLARRSSALVLVNCNPWQAVPDAQGKRDTNWHDGQPVQIMGLAAQVGVARSGPDDPKYCSVWTDRQGAVHIGRPADLALVREGVAGFLQLVQGGKVVQAPGGAIHPRTALGLDSSGRYLYLVVVDGRQVGYSEGMSYFELAAYMKDLGCQDAVNLDGGGSSIMMAATAEGGYRVLNDPSTKKDGISVPRPIPAALVVRHHEPAMEPGAK